MMNSGELAHTTANPESSRPSSPASFTDLQTIPIQTPHHDNCLHQGAASNTAAHNTDDMESFSYSGCRQLNAGDQGQYVNLPVGGLHPSLHDHPYASLDPSDDAASVRSPGVLEQQSFLTKLVRKETKRSRKKQVYIKKPLNAFMLFMKEKRATVRPAIKRRGNCAVTAHLGSVWNSLSRKEQEKYYKEAEQQRFLHQQQHPDWSASEPHGKIITKAEKQGLQENRDEGKSDSEPEESPPSKWMMLTSKYGKQTSAKDGTEIRWDMKLRSGKRPNYQE